MDVAMSLAAFEEINQVRISIRMGVVDQKGVEALSLQAEAWDRKGENGDQQPLVLVKLLVGSYDRRSMGAVIFQLIYALDAELARVELDQTLRKG